MPEATVRVEAKPALTSKLNILGVVQTVVGILDAFGATDVLGSEKAAYALMASGILTIILRLFTNRPVAATKKMVDVKQAA